MQAGRGVPAAGGVSSFGLGGTNAHVVLEQAPDVPPAVASPRPFQLFALGKTEPARGCSARADGYLVRTRPAPMDVRLRSERGGVSVPARDRVAGR